MHPLTDNEYFPALTDGYVLYPHPRDDGYSGLALSVFRTGAESPVYTQYISISTDKISNKEALKSALLFNAKQVARMPREWNPEFVQNLREAMTELTPPKDDPSTEHEREVEGIIAEARRKAYNL